MFNPGDIVSVDFPGATGIKRRPAIVLSSKTYHALRPDIIVGLITSRTKGLGITDYMLQDWKVAGLRIESVFRSFIVTLPKSTGMTPIGHVSEQDWVAIRNCLKIAHLDLTD